MGARLVSFGLGLGFVVSGLLLAGVLWGMGVLSARWGGASQALGWGSLGVFLVGSSSALVGWALLTAPIPGQPRADPCARSARWARWSLGAFVAWMLACVAMVRFAPVSWSATSPWILIILASAHAWFAMDYARALAERVPDARWAVELRRTRWLVVALVALGWMLIGAGTIAAATLYWMVIDNLYQRLRALARADTEEPATEPVP